MAKIRDLADALASRGRGQDSLLAHINPREAMVLKARGGSGVRNPRTGILEFDDNAPTGDEGASDPGFPDATDTTASEGLNAPGINSPGITSPDQGFESNFNNTDVLGFNTENAPESNFQDTNVLSEPNQTTDQGILGKFGKGLMGLMSSQAQNALGKGLGIPNGTLGIMGLANNAGKGPAAAGQGFGSIAGGMLGTAVAGPIGGAIGSSLGGSLGESALGGVTGAGQGMGPSNGATGDTAGNAGGNSGFDWGSLGQGLAGMYMGNRSNNQYSGAINSINDLYGVNSPYAQNMRQQLERRDAASGRRSQYGNREVELAGNLAQAQGQALTSPGYANLMQQRNIQQNQGLNTLLTLLSKSGALKGIGGGLQGLFGGGSGTGNGAPGGYSLGPNGGPQQPIDTGGILDMFNQGGGNGGGFGGGGSDYTPWEGGWGG